MVEAYSDNITDYLISSEIIDFNNDLIKKVSDELWETSEDKVAYIKAAFEYIRDNIAHSADINNNLITCKASEVLREKHGICFAKSHLLAAMLRYKSIPTGFCYQKLILDDETAPVLIYHGLNGVYLEEVGRWIRLDPRGNKPGVNAQFSIENEQLAFPVREELGEEDGLIVYPNPDINVLKALSHNKTRMDLWDNLPKELAYKN